MPSASQDEWEPPSLESQEPPISILFDHACRLYKAMFEQSTLSEGEDGDMVTYEGHLTHLVKALNYSTPYYTKLRKHLMRMGCIQQLRRGGGTAPSVWWLKKEPDEESFKHAVEMLRPGNRPQDAIAQQLKDHNERILVLEQALEIR